MSLDCTRLYILVIWTYVYTYLRKQVRSVLFTAETVLPLEIDILMLYPIFIEYVHVASSRLLSHTRPLTPGMCNKQIITVKLNHGNPAQNIFHSGTKVYKDEGNLKGFFGEGNISEDFE